MKRISILILVGLSALLVFLIWAAQGKLSTGDYSARILQITNVNSIDPYPQELRVLTWNLAFAHGRGSEGKDYKKEDKKFYQAKLQLMGKLIKKYAVDIVLLQEVDFASSRTYFIDEAQSLAKYSHLNYVAYAPSWSHNYLPFPYWPPSKQWGEMKSGGAILSRWPILENKVHLFEKPLSNPWFYNIFYLYRYYQKAIINKNNSKIKVLNLHLEAYKRETRLLQSKILKSSIIKEPDILLAAGDFNSSKADKELQILSSLGHYQFTNENGPTFPSWNAKIKLDHFLISKKMKIKEVKVLNEAGEMSDHLPILLISSDQ